MALVSPRREVSEFRKRYKWMALAVVITFFVFVGRAVHLQVVQNDKWSTIAEDNVTRTISLPATRGVIRDAIGRVVADNRSSYRVFVTPRLVDTEPRLRRIIELMELGEEEAAELRAKISRVPEARRTHQIEVFADVTRDQAAALETHALEVPGVDVVAVPQRTYPYGALGAHSVGYVNEVNADDIKVLGEKYRAGDKLGRIGVEKAWEDFLRGTNGFHRVFVDARGRRQDTVDADHDDHMHGDPQPGHDLSLTLDMELMRAIENAFRGHPSGSAVVVDVHTGAILALYSKPVFDPNDMSAGLTGTAYKQLTENAFRPLIDKTVSETYFPGSTFKVVTALAGLDSGIVTPADRVECPGFYQIGRRRFRCGHAHGDVDMKRAIVQSCNVYFWKIAEKIGIDTINKYARDLGFGESTGLGINSEAKGVLTSRAWYEKQYGSRYLIGYTLNTAIGQGNTRVTLLQLALAYGAIANGGTLFAPQLVDHVSAPNGGVIEQFPARQRRALSIAPEHIQTVVEGLVGVVNDPNGTAFEARIEGGVRTAGKTGTAQVAYRAPKPGEDAMRSEYFNRDHAWFAGFAPVHEPKIAIAVLVEHGGGGGKYAAPIAFEVIEHYLGGSSVATTAEAAPLDEPDEGPHAGVPSREPALTAGAQ